jgi:hypothetical protein
VIRIDAVDSHWQRRQEIERQSPARNVPANPSCCLLPGPAGIHTLPRRSIANKRVVTDARLGYQCCIEVATGALGFVLAHLTLLAGWMATCTGIFTIQCIVRVAECAGRQVFTGFTPLHAGFARLLVDQRKASWAGRTLICIGTCAGLTAGVARILSDCTELP